MTLPAFFTELRADIEALPDQEKLNLLLEFANDLPELPEHLADHLDLMEQVLECQSPVYLFAELDDEQKVHIHATAPKEAPTTRGFASILAQGVEGLGSEEFLALPDDTPFELGLTRIVSPLRLRGMVGMIARAKRQVREALAGNEG
ncbi:SufE family protein [Pseudoclavibacter alba]|uniref:SufE family protein n=1 Tax=Pseudoclavibacter albus TaxID=272241 RepID=A0ABT2HYG4_9MICO|nr:SufE family protein [Pseudoclavibacter alba]MBN6777907.1 SufE family protein [Pseudoclavibacter alba]MCT2043358.1 SufE family protein [Pseudoclavibacter alba]